MYIHKDINEDMNEDIKLNVESDTDFLLLPLKKNTEGDIDAVNPHNSSNTVNIKKWEQLFNNPKTALLVILIFLIAYFLSEGLTGGFGNNFLSFGPTIDESTGKPITFMGINLDSWKDVCIVYMIILLSTILQSYYSNVVYKTLYPYVFNPAVDIVPFSKFWTYLILIIDPIIYITFRIIIFYATATFQIQYILPQFLGSYIIDLPFTLHWLNGKKYTS